MLIENGAGVINLGYRTVFYNDIRCHVFDWKPQTASSRCYVCGIFLTQISSFTQLFFLSSSEKRTRFLELQ